MLALCVAIALTGSRAETRRGDAPRCQEECFTHYAAQMKKLVEQFKRTGNKPEYEDMIDQALSAHQECLTNCREPMPVK